MSITLESVLNDALKLPPEDRALLADRLHESLGSSGGEGGDMGFSNPEIEKAWIEEVERRSAEIDRGEATLLSEEEFRRRLWSGRGR